MRREPEEFEFTVIVHSERAAEMERREMERRHKIREYFLKHRWKIFTRTWAGVEVIAVAAVLLVFAFCTAVNFGFIPIVGLTSLGTLFGKLAPVGIAIELGILCPFAILGAAYACVSIYERLWKHGQGAKTKVVQWFDTHEDGIVTAGEVLAIIVFVVIAICVLGIAIKRGLNNTSPDGDITSFEILMAAISGCYGVSLISTQTAYVAFKLFNLIGDYEYYDNLTGGCTYPDEK